MLHEKWSDYTKGEVKKIFTNKCMHCPYVCALHRSASGAVDEYYCNYIGITEKKTRGTARGLRALQRSGCTKSESRWYGR